MRCVTFAASVLVVVSRLAWADAPLKNADPAPLVRQLGGKTFAEREAAEQKIIALGPKAKPAVRAGVRDPDAEVSRRCQALLKRIRDDERAAFVAGKLDWPGPAGKKFRDIVGDGDASRKLFGEVLKVDACCDVVERLTDAPNEARTYYASELTRLKKAWQSALADLGARPADLGHERLRQEARLRVQPVDVVLVLLLETFRKPEDAGKPVSLYELLSASFMDLARGPLREPFRKLFLAWLERQTEAGDLVAGLDASLCAPIPEAVPVARRVLKEPKVMKATVGRAILLLGHQGGVEDLSRISVFRADARNYQPWQGANGEKMEVQVRDIAAAMSLKIRRRDPADYGFKAFRMSPWWSEPAFYETPVAFPTTEAREAAHKKAWAWLDEKAKGPKE
jgi:hypothetical protein